MVEIKVAMAAVIKVVVVGVVTVETKAVMVAETKEVMVAETKEVMVAETKAVMAGETKEVIAEIRGATMEETREDMEVDKVSYEKYSFIILFLIVLVIFDRRLKLK